jgi:diaminobutyrate-2-oxoglutarate transaminase
MTTPTWIRSQLADAADDAPRPQALDALVASTALVESAARSYPASFPISFAGGEDHYLIGADGRRYLDLLTGAGVMLLGHNHPNVRRAIDGPAHPIISSLDLVTTAKAEFLDSLGAVLPETLRGRAKVHFCGPTGSDSVEAALKLARIATGRTGVFAFAGSYHGMSQGALAVTSKLQARRAGLRMQGEVQFMPFPYPFRSRLAHPEALIDQCLDAVATALEDDHSGIERPGAMLIEAVQGEGGNIVAPRRFLTGLRDLCDRHGILLVFDEIQSGLGRTGRWFAFEHADVRPDMMCLSKGIGGGFPLSLLIYERDLDRWSAGDHIGTFRGQEYAFRAGRATLETIRDEGLVEAATRKGRRLAEGLGGFANHPGYGELRGLGLFLGLECRALGGLSAGTVTSRLQRSMLEHGVIIERGGRDSSVLRFLPPLTIAEAELDRVVETVGAAFATLPT